ncbi:YoaK family protein [Curvibacter sp. APW13]|uniref:YoaK family protein n=1 Tax=Curvibacter sp. APW13 TaxID=3077236 RepID=UPI0028DEA98E|nr:YoaK family protein [Curvibacter sp. APW13]MDT8989470.1 YoaK family protein [Curvibacter sp. APW13]
MIPLLHGWTTVQRSAKTNLRLGATLCFVAGATNAGGFLAVGQYTSHMTGIVSSLMDDVVLGNFALAAAALASLAAFVAGAMTTAWMVNWALRRKLHSAYGRPLLLEAALLLVFGLFGVAIADLAHVAVPATVLILCYIMGLQNAVITKISHAEIRTTHLTGLLTDLGIELGKLFYVNRLDRKNKVHADRGRLRIQSTLIASFCIGALAGAMGFKHFGYIATVPLALLLVLLVMRPVLDDAKRWIHPH